jgi:hypothetical protein
MVLREKMALLMSTVDGKREVRKQPFPEKPRYRSFILEGSAHLSFSHPTHFDPEDQGISLKYWYTPTRLHGITIQMTTI